MLGHPPYTRFWLILVLWAGRLTHSYYKRRVVSGRMALVYLLYAEICGLSIITGGLTDCIATE